MSERLTHEEYVASVRQHVVDTAREMLSGEISFLDGALTLFSLRHEADVPDADSDFMTFVVIESDTDDLPLGNARKQWSEDALRKLQPKYEEAEFWAREIGTEACESLIRRFHV